MANTFSKLFKDHPEEVGETYLQHMATSAGFGLLLVKLATCAFVHALVPGLHRTTVSDTVRALAKDMNGRAREAQETRMKNAGVWDPGL
jgi:hypothetical protein